jgi:hypothetical protein
MVADSTEWFGAYARTTFVVQGPAGHALVEDKDVDSICSSEFDTDAPWGFVAGTRGEFCCRADGTQPDDTNPRDLCCTAGVTNPATCGDIVTTDPEAMCTGTYADPRDTKAGRKYELTYPGMITQIKVTWPFQTAFSVKVSRSRQGTEVRDPSPHRIVVLDGGLYGGMCERLRCFPQDYERVEAFTGTESQTVTLTPAVYAKRIFIESLEALDTDGNDAVFCSVDGAATVAATCDGAVSNATAAECRATRGTCLNANTGTAIDTGATTAAACTLAGDVFTSTAVYFEGGQFKMELVGSKGMVFGDWNKLYHIELDEVSNYDHPYDIDYSEIDNTPKPFDRIGYHLQLDDKFVLATMDAFTVDPKRVGIPVNDMLEAKLEDLHVVSNVPGVAIPDAVGGRLEFWGHCYKTGADDVFDVWDAPSDTDCPSLPNCYGSMQVHTTVPKCNGEVWSGLQQDCADGFGTCAPLNPVNPKTTRATCEPTGTFTSTAAYTPGDTVFAYNGWTSQNHWGSSDLGIGPNPDPDGHPDWTFAQNAHNYGRREIEVYARHTSMWRAPDPTEIEMYQLEDDPDITKMYDDSTSTTWRPVLSAKENDEACRGKVGGCAYFDVRLRSRSHLTGVMLLTDKTYAPGGIHVEHYDHNAQAWQAHSSFAVRKSSKWQEFQFHNDTGHSRSWRIVFERDGGVDRPLIKEMRFADDQEHLNLALFRR